MNISVLFICGSLEPGKDGVGDYTRILAAELQKFGCTTHIVSLYDKDVDVLTQECQYSQKREVAVSRVPIEFNLQLRYAHLSGIVKKFNPCWISLQFVPYSFHKKGMPITLVYHLKKLHGNFQWHIMFHELWVGTNHALSFKKALIKKIQKALVFNLFKVLKPSLATTSNTFYAELLQNYVVSVLPLFSNIGFINVPDLKEKDKVFRVIHFGNFTGDLVELEGQLNFVCNISSKHQIKEVKILCVGSGGVYKEQSLELIRSQFQNFEIVDFGRTSEHEISKLLQLSDLGISRADRDMLGKSGSSMAMLEHGLPILLKGERVVNKNDLIDQYFYEQLHYSKDIHLKFKAFEKHPMSEVIASMFYQKLLG
ncbi:hypothetical protein [Leeuwenhoekiella sp. LLG6367-2.1]|uniref:hypothetical protein n=1 Tax=Leeuwenhoekiella sp. LLG6367-2.1 TaxID=3160833 RepID=UPI00386D8747